MEKISGYARVLARAREKTRAEAFDMMLDHASQLGANAVIGVRSDAMDVLQGVTEVLCYGTAVLVEPSAK